MGRAGPRRPASVRVPDPGRSPEAGLSWITILRKRATYRLRPAYQQNDYIGWIIRAKQPSTQQKRLAQMLDELVRGDVYMKMAWRGTGTFAACSSRGEP